MNKIIKITICTLAMVMTMGALCFATTTVKAEEPTTEQPTTQAPEPVKIKVGKSTLKVSKCYEKHVKLTWSKGKNAKGYYVYRAPKGGDFNKVATTSSVKYVDKKANKRTTYSYKIVGYAKSSGKTFTSGASNIKKVYVRPKNPKVVICGECFVEGMHLYAKRYRPKNSSFVYKIGLSTYGLLNTNCKKYQGQTVTCLERVAYYNPDRVYFLIGMNEAKNGSPSSTINNYKKAFKLLKKVNPNVEMVIMALPPVGRSHSSGFASNGGINRYNRAYKKYANKTKNVFYYDSYRRLISDGAGYLKANGGDGGHWSAGGTIKVVKDLKKHSKKLTKR